MENIMQANNSRLQLYDVNRYLCSINEWGQKNQAAYQNSKQTSCQNKREELFTPVQMIKFQSNTSKTDLDWLPFNDEPKGLF